MGTELVSCRTGRTGRGDGINVSGLLQDSNPGLPESRQDTAQVTVGTEHVAAARPQTEPTKTNEEHIDALILTKTLGGGGLIRRLPCTPKVILGEPLQVFVG